MGSKAQEGIIMKRIRNQLRIHWGWLKNKKADEVADFIDGTIRQALARGKDGK